MTKRERKGENDKGVIMVDAGFGFSLLNLFLEISAEGMGWNTRKQMGYCSMEYF